jgi:hypothetical protein
MCNSSGLRQSFTGPGFVGDYLLLGKANPGKHTVLNNLYSPARIINNQLVWFMFPKYISCYRQD